MTEHGRNSLPLHPDTCRQRSLRRSFQESSELPTSPRLNPPLISQIIHTNPVTSSNRHFNAITTIQWRNCMGVFTPLELSDYDWPPLQGQPQ